MSYYDVLVGEPWYIHLSVLNMNEIILPISLCILSISVCLTSLNTVIYTALIENKKIARQLKD